MTNAHGHSIKANRSRLLTSIFARNPRDTSASATAHFCTRSQPTSVSERTEARATPTGWRDVATRHTRESLAERLCARFFTREAKATSALQAHEADFPTAGQRLQSLSQDADAPVADPASHALILDGPARSAGTALQDMASDDGSGQAGLTAKAA
jgi:hypothetical protein